MSSDLPDMRPDTSLAFARLLVNTMHCDMAVQRRIREDFDHPPAIRTIRRLRIEAGLNKLPTFDPDPFKAHEGYYPAEVSDTAARRNRAFLDALRTAYPERFAA